MKLLFDNIIFASQKSGGISVVWYELLKRVLRDHPEAKFIDFTPNDNIMRELLDINPTNIIPAKKKYKKELKYLPVFYRSKEPFIFHSSYYRISAGKRAINVTTVHDFTNELYMKGLAALEDRWIKHHAIRHSDAIACISENTRKDFFKFFPNFPKNKVKVIYNGVSDTFKPIDKPEEWLYPFNPGEYILFVGARDGYKNFRLLVDALKEYDINLILTGSQLTASETSELSQIKGKYHYAGRVSEQELNILYNFAYALVYPSLYEGFGLPVIEAQKAGCPVIALKASSIPEIIGNTPLLLDESDKDLLIKKLNLLKNKQIRDSVIQEGVTNSCRFSWEKCYQGYLELYKSALDK